MYTMADNNTLEDCLSYSSNVSDDLVKLWQYSRQDIIVITIIIPIILCLGVINNSAYLFVIFRVPTMRSATNICLAHLALADLLYLTVNSSVFFILKYAASPFMKNIDIMKSSPECFIFGFLKNVGYLSSIAIVTTVSFERYLAVCHPIKHLKIRGQRRTNTMVATCWVMALVLAFPTTLGTIGFIQKICVVWPEDYKDQFFSNISYCGPLSFNTETLTIPLTFVIWSFAMVSNVYMYIRIIHTMTKRRSANYMRGKDRKAQHSRNKVAQVLIINGVVFFFCQTPSILVDAILCYHRFNRVIEDDSFAILHYKNGSWFTHLPLLINAIVNPLIYAIINTQYRSAFIRAFRCKIGSNQPGDKNILAVSLSLNKSSSHDGRE
ncbi:tachykinin-like peptides receptor 86C [Asterias amurensis]|uniref:tachykinin-like peptides receptor 86C n=1 Tax=Asterias amurensis TaxID=7602 RepID=UPI003AB19A67